MCAIISTSNNPIQKKILTAAGRVFARRGFDAATMTAIAKQAGISRTLLNYYYRSKDRLFLDIHESAAEDLGKGLVLIINRQDSILEKLPDLVAHYMRWLRENPRLPMMNELRSRHFDAELRHRLRRDFAVHYGFFKLMRQYRDEVKSGKLRDVSFAHAIMVLHGLTSFLFIAQDMIRSDWTGPNDADFDRFIDEQLPLSIRILENLLKPERTREATKEHAGKHAKACLKD